MKKSIFLLLLVSVLFGCSGGNSLNSDDVLKNLVNERKQSVINTEGLSVDYDEAKQIMSLSSKGDIMTVSYDVKYTNLTEPTPKANADNFLVSMVVIKEGITSISHVEFIVDGVKIRVTPFNNEAIGDKKEIVIAGLSILDESFCKLMCTLQNVIIVDAAYAVTDNGSVRIPDKDIINLQSMAQSYVLDGGTFEYKTN